MEATIFNKKKKSVNKAKLKKTIKNVLCKPDPVIWPLLSDEEGKELIDVLQKYRVDIPEFKKLHWSELKLIPKDQRPKEPKPKKVEGLIFGISHCTKTIFKSECLGIVLDAGITPRLLLEHVIEACVFTSTPIVCLKNLKEITKTYFGCQTCCLGIGNTNNLEEIRLKIIDCAKSFNLVNKSNVKENIVKIDTTKEVVMEVDKEKKSTVHFTYLYRTSKASRVFVPISKVSLDAKITKNFSGQDFIDVDKVPLEKPFSGKFKNMIVKRISNNPNRKRKHK